MRNQKPRGVNRVEYYTSSKRGANCTIIGVEHNRVSPPDFRDFLESFNPTAVCVEAPDASVLMTEHKGADLYCDRDSNRAKLVAIDRKYHTMSDEIDEYSRQMYEESREAEAKGKTYSEMPKIEEEIKVRNQYMSTETLDAMDFFNGDVVAIVGYKHVDGMKRQMRAFENKYNY